MFKGCGAIYQAVTTTLGPKGGNVVIEMPYGPPRVLHDGVSVAKEILLEDPEENLGAELLIEAADRTNTNAGDGTTTAVLIAYEIVKLGLRQINNGENAQVFKEELKAAANKVIEKLREYKREVNTKDQVEHVATIASVDPVVGKLVAEAYEKIGEDGTVTVDVGHKEDIELEIKEGLVIPSGYLIPIYVTDREKLKTELADPHILVTDEEVTSVNEIAALFQEFSSKFKEIVVVAPAVGGSALATIVLNAQQGVLRPLLVKAPRAGELRKRILEDIAVATGAKFISRDLGRNLSTTKLEDLGSAEKVVGDRTETLVIGGRGNKQGVKDRIAEIRGLIKMAENDFERENARERLAKLAGGIAVIYSGGSSEAEITEKRYRIEDAINAAKAAREEGIIPGGGVSLYHAREVLSGKETVGERILYEVLAEPIIRLWQNAGINESEWLHKLDRKRPELVLNVLTGEMGDAFEMGVVDPFKVPRLALENAVATAGMILTSGATITRIREKNEKGSGVPGAR